MSQNISALWLPSSNIIVLQPRFQVMATVCDFFLKFLRMASQRMTTLLCTVHTVQSVLLISADGSEEEERLSLSRSIFYIKFHSSVRNVDAALSDPVCSTPNIYACDRNFMCTSGPFSTKTRGDKIAAQRMDTASFALMRSTSST